MSSIKVLLIALVLSLLSVQAEAASGGASFAETLRPLQTAREAGSGGIDLEDMWFQETRIEANTILLSSDLRWYGLSFLGNIGSGIRGGFQAFLFSAPDITRTVEAPDGTFGGDQGTLSPQEWGGRVFGLLTIWKGRDWQIRALGRGSGVIQKLPNTQNAGFGLDAGLQYQKRLSPSKEFLAWGFGGPLGRGSDKWFSSQVTLGAGFVQNRVLRATRSVGQGLGAELEFLGEGLVHFGVGTVLWLGDPASPGGTFFLRGGVRHRPKTVQELQIRGGLGALWHFGYGWATQFDYAFVPMGDLGSFHYVTLAINHFNISIWP